MLNPDLLKPNKHGGQEYYRFRSNRIQIKWRKLVNGTLIKFADKMIMKKRWQRIENRNQTIDEKIWWWRKMKRLEHATPKRSWLIYAYAISRVDKIKCRIKWKNLNLVEMLGVSYQKILNGHYRWWKKMTCIIYWINYHEYENKECNDWKRQYVGQYR